MDRAQLKNNLIKQMLPSVQLDLNQLKPEWDKFKVLSISIIVSPIP